MYRFVFTATGLFCCLLGALLLLGPQQYLSLYVDVYGVTMAFAAQRLAPAVLGLGAFLIVARDVPRGPVAVRLALCAGLVWLGVAATGVFHFATGVANANILIAAVLETALGMVFLTLARTARDVT